jgi:hypothetical protein
MGGDDSMTDRQSQTSRRKLFRAVAGGLSAGLFLRVAPVVAADKMTKPQAEYQDMPNGIYSCGTCTLFEQPASCKVVDGEISKDGWCKAYAMAD